MSSSNPVSRDLEAEADDDALEYRAISTPAVAGLVLGLLSVLAFIHPLLWLFPLLGAIMSGWALSRLNSPDAVQAGRTAALIGLTLSLSLSAAAPGRWALQRWQFRAETRHLAKQWFQALHEGNPYAAHQLTLYPWQRVSAGDDPATRYAEPQLRREIEGYLQEPPVQVLLSLGKHAAVHYMKNEDFKESAGEAGVTDIYAVSVQDQGTTSSFFVQLHWVRNFNSGDRSWSWRLSSAEFLRSTPLALLPSA